MTIMKAIITHSVAIFLGLGLGWYLEYTRSVGERQLELLAHHEWVKDQLQLTDEEILQLSAGVPQYLEAVMRQDEITAAVALHSFALIERGDVDRAKEHLAWHVGSYFRLYHGKGGDTNLLLRIEEAAREHPGIAAQISEAIQ